MSNRDDRLSTRIEDGRLHITMGIDTLIFATTVGRGYGSGDVTLLDTEGFVQDVLSELVREAEDGSTPVHHLLDAAVTEAIEQGSQHVQYDE